MILKKATAVLVAIGMLLVSLAATAPSAQAQQSLPDGLVVLESTQSFEATWSALTAALDANPNIRTIATVDHRANAESADLTLGNNRVVFFGNPALGTPLMQANRTAGIDLPQKMQVYEDNGSVYVTYNATTYLSSRHATGAVDTLNVINGALAGLAQAATNTQSAVNDAVQPTVSAGAGLVTTTSANDFDTTWANLISAIDGSPAAVGFIVDHAANSDEVLPPTRLVVFGNPAIGTPIMASSPSSGIDLPLKMLVFEDDAGVTHVVSTSPGFVQSRHGVGDVPTIANATGAISNFTRAATTAPTNAATSPANEGSGGTSTPDELAFTGGEPIAFAGAILLIGLGSVFAVGARRREQADS